MEQTDMDAALASIEDKLRDLNNRYDFAAAFARIEENMRIFGAALQTSFERIGTVLAGCTEFVLAKYQEAGEPYGPGVESAWKWLADQRTETRE